MSTLSRCQQLFVLDFAVKDSKNLDRRHQAAQQQLQQKPVINPSEIQKLDKGLQLSDKGQQPKR